MLYVIVCCFITGEVAAWVADMLRRTHSDLVVTQEELVSSERLAAMGEMAMVIGHECATPSLRRPTGCT